MYFYTAQTSYTGHVFKWHMYVGDSGSHSAIHECVSHWFLVYEQIAS